MRERPRQRESETWSSWRCFFYSCASSYWKDMIWYVLWICTLLLLLIHSQLATSFCGMFLCNGFLWLLLEMAKHASLFVMNKLHEDPYIWDFLFNFIAYLGLFGNSNLLVHLALWVIVSGFFQGTENIDFQTWGCLPSVYSYPLSLFFLCVSILLFISVFLGMLLVVRGTVCNIWERKILYDCLMNVLDR